MYGDVARSVSILATRRDELHIVAQNLIEFWAVATRPIIDNGLGLKVAQAEQELTKLKTLFTVLPDTVEILPEWEQLVVKHRSPGRSNERAQCHAPAYLQHRGFRTLQLDHCC